MDAFSLVATLTLSDASYEKGLKDASKEASSFSSKFNTGMHSAAKTATAFIGTLSSVASSLAKLTLDTVSMESELANNATALGMTNLEYQEWCYLLDQAGIGSDSLSSYVKKLNSFTEDLAKGDADAMMALDKLNISYEDFMAMSVSERLDTIIKALQSVEDADERTTLATQIFGSALGTELGAIINNANFDLDEYRDRLQEINGVISDESIEAASDLQSQVTDLQYAWKALTAEIAETFYPALSEILDWLVNTALPWLSDVWENDLSEPIGNLFDWLTGDSLWGSVGGVFDSFITLITDVGSTIASIFGGAEGDFKLFGSMSEKYLGPVCDILSAILDGVDWVWNAFVGLFSDVPESMALFWDDLKEFGAWISDWFKSLWGSFTDWISNAWNSITDFFKGIPGFFTDLWSGIWSWLCNVVDTFKNFFTITVPGWFSNLWTTIKTWFNTLGTKLYNGFVVPVANFFITCINSVIDAVEWLVNKCIQAINSFTSGLSKIWTWTGIPAIGKISEVSWSGITPLAEKEFEGFAGGGIIDDIFDEVNGMGSMYAVAGEAGAEMVATGPKGTGVANIEQIAQAQYEAMERYGFNEAVADAAVAVVNGIISACRSSQSAGSGEQPAILRIDDKDFSAWIYDSVNDTLKMRGRKSLNSLSSQ